MAPRDGLPSVIDTPRSYAVAIDELAAGVGPLAIDTERAQSYRYSARAYLIQMRRAGVGTRLVDPIALQTGPEPADLSALAQALAPAEWILHAASQDLPCLAEVGMLPARLFDTELAGRLLGFPRVGLGTMLEELLGVRLLKEHSAADWSVRPLPDELLAYAALDVDFLAELRDVLAQRLVEAGKDEWARQEFEWLARQGFHVAAPDPTERWRRIHSLNHIRTRRGLAVARELWTVRDQLAHDRDLAPGRVLKDAAIVELACQVGGSAPVKMSAVAGFHRRIARKNEPAWQAALARAMALSERDLPPTRLLRADLPSPRAWQRTRPEAWLRWTAVRPLVVELAERVDVPAENLIPPQALRQLAWAPPVELDEASVAHALAEAGARPWQCDLVAPVVTPALARTTA